MNSRRTTFDIVADILRLDGAGVTKIMYTANLSYFQLKRYLSSLMEGDFIAQSREANGLTPYRVTSKGYELLKRIEAVLDMLSPIPEP
jgi:predicted transcriptional regulator